MADPILVTVDSRPPADTLTGAELVPVVQGGVLKRITAQDVANLAATTAASAGATGWRPPPLVTADSWGVLYAVTDLPMQTRASVAFQSEYYPFEIDRDIVISAIGIDVTVAAASTTEVAIYDLTASRLPGAKLFSASFTNTSSTGFKSLTVSLALPAGSYWMGFQTNNSSLQLRGLAQSSVMPLGTVASPPTSSFAKYATGGNGLLNPATGSLGLSASLPAAVFVKY